MHSLDYTSCPNLAGGCILSYHSLGPYHLPNVTLQKWSLLVEADLTSKALQQRTGGLKWNKSQFLGLGQPQLRGPEKS